MAIPRNITKENILQAIGEIDERGYEPKYESKMYVLKMSGKCYPPKYVVRLANRFANRNELDSSSYIPLEANRLLERFGFTVERLQSGESEEDTKQRASLAGVILRNWIDDGRPTLTWDDVLSRAAKADADLERSGLNPARVFRRYRLDKNTGEMQRYISGFYEYEFAPNYNPREKKRKRLDVRRAVAPQPTTSEPLNTHRSTAETVLELTKRMESILQQLEPRGFNQDLATWINEIERQGRLPSHVKFRMHAIRSLRNKVVHQDYRPTPAELTALASDWAIIDEWWRGRKT